MKVNISASIDDTLNNTLKSYCERKIEGSVFRRSKSEVIADALLEYFEKKGMF